MRQSSKLQVRNDSIDTKPETFRLGHRIAVTLVLKLQGRLDSALIQTRPARISIHIRSHQAIEGAKICYRTSKAQSTVMKSSNNLSLLPKKTTCLQAYKKIRLVQNLFCFKKPKPNIARDERQFRDRSLWIMSTSALNRKFYRMLKSTKKTQKRLRKISKSSLELEKS